MILNLESAGGLLDQEKHTIPCEKTSKSEAKKHGSGGIASNAKDTMCAILGDTSRSPRLT